MRKLNKAILSAIVIGGISVAPTGVYANTDNDLISMNQQKLEEKNKPGNGNEGCWIDDIPGHKKGQSNEHKITTMTKHEWEDYLNSHNIEYKQMSNNEGSNGWITYHLYNNGKQVEVVHIRFKVDDIPMTPLEPSNPVDKEETESKSKDEVKDINRDKEISGVDNPKTGDVGILTFAATGITSLIGLVAVNRKRK